MEAKRSVVVIECRVELVRPMDTAAIDDHHDVFAGFAEGCHHLMDVLAQFLGVKMGHNFIVRLSQNCRLFMFNGAKRLCCFQ